MNDKFTMNDKYLAKIKQLILLKPKMTTTTNLEANDYTFVVKMWIHFKKTGKLLIDDYTIRSAFEFHKSNVDHIICYYSKDKPYALLLCKIFGKYINMQIPAETTYTFKSSAIATYVN